MAAGDTPVQPRRKRRSEWWIVGGVLVALAGALAFAVRDMWTAPADGPITVAEPQAANGPPEERHVAAKTSSLPGDDLVDNDGETLWTSPTHGRPLDLAYLPPGVEIILALRPAELLAHPEGEKVVAALGPLGTHAIASLELSTGVKLDAIDRLVVGWQIARDGAPVATMVVTTAAPLKISGDNYQPAGDQGRVTVFGPPSALDEVRSLAGQPPPFVRDLERALSHTDALRGVTLLVRPRALLNDASNVLQGPMSLLRRPLESILGENVAAAALSMNWDENFFVELVAVPTLDSSPEKMSNELAGRIDKLPGRVEEFVLGLQTTPYGRRVVARLPEMVRRLAAYTRHGFDRDAAVLRCYLPLAAGHNLLMGAELALAEASGGERREGADGSPLAKAIAPQSPKSILERLQAKTSLRFDREELEAALDMLAQDLGMRIVIRGPDLQLDGITRNQLFAIDMAERTGEQILVEILRRANPDKLAAGPADPRQKLVYVAGPDAVYITTRSQAAERGEVLPAVFRPGR